MPFLGTTGGGSVKQYGGQANLGYFIKNSLRFRASNNNYLARTYGTPTNNKVWTWSAWVKRGSLSLADADHLFFASPTDVSGNPSSYTRLVFETDGTLRLQSNASAGELFTSSALFRDPAAWYHIVLYMDAVNTTVRCYINGTEIAYASRSNPTNTNTSINGSGNFHRMGFFRTAEPRPMDGYMAEVNFVDGQALTPSSFGKTDGATNQWIPKKFAGTYGTNGFYLKFADASAATAAAIGKDSSGNGNNWTPSGISVTSGITYDAMTDSPTRSGAASNYATLNPLDKFTSLPAPTNGNLSQANGAAAWYNIRSTIGVTSGKWYAEVTQSGSNLFAGVMSGSSALNFSSYTNASGLYAFFNNGGGTTGYKYANGTSGSSFTIADNDVIGLAYDYDAQTLAIYRNGNLQDTVTSIPKTETMFFCASHAQTTGSTVWNFGQRPFAQSVPSGYKSLNTFNLP